MVGVRGIIREECDTAGGVVAGVSSTVGSVIRGVSHDIVSVCTSACCISGVSTSGVHAHSSSTWLGVLDTRSGSSGAVAISSWLGPSFISRIWSTCLFHILSPETWTKYDSGPLCSIIIAGTHESQERMFRTIILCPTNSSLDLD